MSGTLITYTTIPEDVEELEDEDVEFARARNASHKLEDDQDVFQPGMTTFVDPPVPSSKAGLPTRPKAEAKTRPPTESEADGLLGDGTQFIGVDAAEDLAGELDVGERDVNVEEIGDEHDPEDEDDGEDSDKGKLATTRSTWIRSLSSRSTTTPCTTCSLSARMAW